jgi:hypothetical protein
MLMAGNAFVRTRVDHADSDLKADTLKVIDKTIETFGHLVKN